MILAILAGFTVWGVFRAAHMRAMPHPDHIRLYTLTLLFEWFIFTLVVLGVKRRGIPLAEILGRRWGSAREAVRDVGIAAAFWAVSLVILAVCAFLLGVQRMGPNVRFMLPRGPLELTLWMALSLSAGICEETVFRGFLQRQFIAWMKNTAAGIVVSAVLFGAGHMYQGWRSAILIGLYGAMFGVLAHWRRNLRPGMMAHAWQDSFSAVVATLVHRSLG